MTLITTVSFNPFAFLFYLKALFLCGRNKYKKVPPEGNIVLLVGCAVGVCLAIVDFSLTETTIHYKYRTNQNIGLSELKIAYLTVREKCFGQVKQNRKCRDGGIIG